MSTTKSATTKFRKYTVKLVFLIEQQRRQKIIAFPSNPKMQIGMDTIVIVFCKVYPVSSSVPAYLCSPIVWKDREYVSAILQLSVCDPFQSAKIKHKKY